ncbi:bifunctional diaminohydroxyphosphoribosylaminopyrimidine deaminase/5-amino-6-(5-phosphoribosylamino)uracil reductase RibD [Maribius pontilimi]|uniref:Riboflavin biosynthesis protein RibD n=2 Tax=Palleronia pontilimi TaxID=1964209 RepID=A0A934IAH1_9RHOB|nr:bifunctional diaminohydroxyphosphoribosylaminopyrimidine deaminase/5-amino-6-(5-phosphoribosylamino)uracil reductase RibD [Palleronia pontilimi]
MRAALSLGRRGLGRVWPNPAVGCVIVKAGRVMGRGWTQPGGRPHAEAVALAQAGDAARGSTAYVTLEPCAHHGKTPPCARALISAGVARVVTALDDPDARVAGRGHAMLRAAGIDVVTGVCEEAARADQIGFLTRVTQGRPMLTLKLAMSLDGRIATASGESQWITGSQARRAVHAARLNHDAVLVGGGTARADDPQLTVRDLGARHQPVRIIAARRLDLPKAGKLAASAGSDLWLLHAEDAPEGRRRAWQEAGARLVQVPLSGGRLDPGALMQELGARGLTRVFCEGGGTFAASLLQLGLVDRLMLFTAGKAIGAEGQPGLGALGLSALADAPQFVLRDVRALGGDTLSLWDRA